MSMLRAFDAYGQTGRIRRAAALLGVSHPIVSRHLKGLEAWLGIMLIDREKGGLTPAGEEFHARVQVALDQIGLASERAMGGVGTRMSIWCIPGFAYLWLTARLPRFSARYPSIALDLRPTDAPPNLVHHQADADIRWVRNADPAVPPRGLESVEIARPRTFPVARPDAPWLQRRDIARPADILALPLLHEESDDDWRDWAGVNGLGDVPVPAAARLWQGHMTLGAACEGQGVALTNHFLAAEHLEAERLVELGGGNPAFGPVSIGSYRFTARIEVGREGPEKWFCDWLKSEVAAAPLHWNARQPGTRP